MRKGLVLACILFSIIGCQDTKVQKYCKTNTCAEIRCFTGTLELYTGTSIGEIKKFPNSNTISFKDLQTGKLKEVSGNCDITYN